MKTSTTLKKSDSSGHDGKGTKRTKRSRRNTKSKEQMEALGDVELGTRDDLSPRGGEDDDDE